MLGIMGSNIFSLFTNFMFFLLYSLKITSLEPSHSHNNDCSALLQLKKSFMINQMDCSGPYAFPKFLSWEEGRDCCSWHGVKCDTDTGSLIGLDLGGGCLYGSLNSSSSLFQLVHLRRLNLAENDFNNSQIPSGIGSFSRLTHLNLSYSSFSGQVPPQILRLSKLVSLDVRGNPSVLLQKPDLRSLVQNLTSLQELNLSNMKILSEVPDNLANLTSLRYLFLKDCGLYGEFPRTIFYLPNIRILSVRFNPNLTGVLPEFHKGSPLQELRLEGTSFSGNLPHSIGKLSSLKWLNLNKCNFSGTIPESFANLTQLTHLLLSYNSFSGSIPTALSNLTQLSHLSLSYNDFSGSNPATLANLVQLCHLSLSFNNFDSWTMSSWIGKQSKLTELYLVGTNLNGELPPFLANLTQLDHLDLRSNELKGHITPWIANLTQLNFLDLSINNFQGSIPTSLFQCLNLQNLDLSGNSLDGEVESGIFTKLRNLMHLHLSGNKLSVLTDADSNATFPNFRLLQLASCNLSKFPEFLQNQEGLDWLDLSDNNIHGEIPKWFCNMSIATLQVLFIDHNCLTGFEQQPAMFLWKHISILSLSSNKLRGSLPIPPSSTNVYKVANNYFTGNLPLILCNLTSLVTLDLSNNSFSGLIPQCLGNFNNNLLILYLQENNFHGTIPQTFGNGSRLHDINLGHNRLEGPLPKSLISCEMLQGLDVSNNQINDTFPYWLGVLPELKILILRHNQFHGVVEDLRASNDFPNLQIIDISHNDFSGNLTAEKFWNWNAIKSPKKNTSEYMEVDLYQQSRGYVMVRHYDIVYSLKLTNKGIETAFWKILNTFMVIDLSSNRFHGEIPASVGNLKGLNVLNLSYNCFEGTFPSSLGNLMALESLDLSHNQFSGQIPEQLTQLIFLEFLNLSYNNFYGLIPLGKQFDTFQNNSYLGNPRLCGCPLSEKCKNFSESPPPSPSVELRQDSILDFDWVVITMGYVSGLVIGATTGWTLATSKHEWIEETLQSMLPKQKRQSKRSMA